MSLEYFEFSRAEALSPEAQQLAVEGGHDYRVQSDYFGGVEILGKRSSQEDRVSHFQLSAEQAQLLAFMNSDVREKFLIELYKNLNQLLRISHVQDGSTGITCLFDPKNQTVHFANLGDSELLHITIDTTHEAETGTMKVNLNKLNTSHGLDNPAERSRVRAGGHQLYQNSPEDDVRLRSQHNLARSLGDFAAVQYGMSHESEVATKILTTGDHLHHFFVVACDGLTEANQATIYKSIAGFVARNYKTMSESELAEGLCKMAYDPTKADEYLPRQDYSQDNISVLVTRFPSDTNARPYQLSVFDGHGGSQSSSILSRAMNIIFNDQLRKTCGLDKSHDEQAVEIALSAGIVTSMMAHKLRLNQVAALGSGFSASVALYQSMLAKRKESASLAAQFFGEKKVAPPLTEDEQVKFQAGQEAGKSWLAWFQVNLRAKTWQGDQRAYHAGKHAEDDTNSLAADFKSRLNLT